MILFFFLLVDNASRRGLCLFYESNDLLTACATSVFEAELQDVIPICHATIAGTRIIGRLIVGYVRHSIQTNRCIRKKYQFPEDQDQEDIRDGN